MRKLRGDHLMIYIQDGGELAPVAASTQCELQASKDLIETSSIFSGMAKSFTTGRYSWQVTCNAFVNNQDGVKFLDACLNGRTVQVRFSVKWLADIGGSCIIQSYAANGNLGSMASYSLTLVGSGPLTISPYSGTTEE